MQETSILISRTSPFAFLQHTDASKERDSNPRVSGVVQHPGIPPSNNESIPCVLRGHKDLNRVEKEDGIDEPRYPCMTHALFGERNVVAVQLGDFKAVQRPVQEVADELG